MKFLKSHKLQNWINALKYRWSLLPPTQRLILLSGTTGGVFVILLSLTLSLGSSRPEIGLSPRDFGLVAQQEQLEKTRLNLLNFSFEKIPPQARVSCKNLVTFEDAGFLQSYRVIRPLSKGQFLCWEDIEDMNAAITAPKIRKGYRALAFELSNPEIASFVSPTMEVDASLGSHASMSLRLERVRILEFFREGRKLNVLLEIPDQLVPHVERVSGMSSTIQLMLRNQEDTSQRALKSHQGPEVKKG